MEIKDTENIDVLAILKGLLDILPFGIVICDEKSDILFYNNNFTYALSFKSTSELCISTNKTHNLLNIIDAGVAAQLENVFERVPGEMLDCFTINRLEYIPSVYPINGNKHFVLILRNSNDEVFLKEELVERLESVIKENLDMVSQIGKILGESSVKRVKALNSFIKVLR